MYRDIVVLRSQRGNSRTIVDSNNVVGGNTRVRDDRMSEHGIRIRHYTKLFMHI